MLRPEYPEALLDLGNMLHEIGQLSQAKLCLQRLVELRPDDAMAYNNLGVICKAQQQHEEAIAAYRRSLELDAPNPETLCNLGHALSRTDDLEGRFASVPKGA